METLSKQELKDRVCGIIDQHGQRIYALGDSVAAEPELGFKEFKTAQKYTKLLDELGYEYESGIARTGVISKIKGRESKLNIAVMAELDAVIVPGHPQADEQTGAVHACGHNCMMAALGGVAIALKESGLMSLFSGDVTLMAVPAEEYIELEYRNALRKAGEIWFLGGKQEFVRLGKMDQVDMMLMHHCVDTGDSYFAGAGAHSNGFIGKLIRYIGKEAHAGVEPDRGVNALNAAMLGLMGIHAQRETFRDEDHIRVHPILTQGGSLVNVVPSDVRMETYVRGLTVDAILDASEKVNRAIRAGGDAVGAQTDITELPGYLPAVLNDGLLDLMIKNLEKLLGSDKVRRICAGLGGGSSDQGDISHLMPSIQSFFGGVSGGLHSEEFRVSDRNLAYLAPAKAITMLLIDLLFDGAKKGMEIKQHYEPKMTKEEYLSRWGGLNG